MDEEIVGNGRVSEIDMNIEIYEELDMKVEVFDVLYFEYESEQQVMVEENNMFFVELVE